MDRRSALKNAGIAGVLSLGLAPAVHAQPALRWRLTSSFPKALDTMNAQNFLIGINIFHQIRLITVMLQPYIFSCIESSCNMDY